MTPKKPNLKRKRAPEPVVEEQDNSEDECYLSDDEGTFIDGIRIPPAQPPTCSFDPTGPRLIITKIVNNFFKSYADEQTLGPFHKCFNAIVGPNGSGKSNVIDSMLFVFGYRATKIRSKKVSVLIHNSEKYSNLQSCTVSVHFALIIDKEGDEYEIVPNSQFVVSRTANKDNSSYYQLDGRRVQFKEVGTILKQHGIDLDHNRFLILQGEVEQIAMMKCKAENEHETGMLEYLEDIIGTTRYKKPLIQVQERVDFLAERRTEKLNRLKLVEDELKELKAPMEEAVTFLKTENTIVTSKNFLFQKDVYNLQDKVKSLEQNKNEVAEVQKDFIDKLNQLKQTKSEKDGILHKEATRHEELTKRKDDMKKAFDKANNKDVELQETMTQMNTKRKKTKEQVVQEKKKLENLKNLPEKVKKDIAECEMKITEMTAKKEKYDAEKAKIVASIRSETAALQEQKETIQTDLVVLKRSVDETKAAFSIAESELKLYISNEENEKSKLEKIKTTYDNTVATIEERSKQVHTLKKKIPATEKSLKEASDEMHAVKIKESHLVNEIKKTRSYLEEKRSSLQATRSQGKVLDSLMQAKREGLCPGLYGRLGDLGAIDRKYDVAVSTACGPLDNIVVDTVNTAQWCIEYLKKYDLGRATFIALDKQEYLRNAANSTIKTPENVPRLFDLITVQDEDVRTAFYYALRDTLVANDLEQASRIAYGAQRYRVVSLGGDLIETTGTMSGGGRTVSRGRMGQKVRVSNIDPSELDNLEQSIQDMESNVREMRQQLNKLESQISTLQPELRQMKFDYEKFNMELQQLQQQQPQLVKQLKEQEARCKTTKADPVQVKKLTAVVTQKKDLYEQAFEAAQTLQVQVDQISKEIEAKSTGKIKIVDKHIKEATSTISKCQKEITRLTVSVRTAERDSVKCNDKIEALSQEIKEMESKLIEMKGEREEIEKDGARILECTREITEQLEEAEEAYSEIKQEVAALTKKENKLKSEKVEIDQKVKEFDSKINEHKGIIHQLEVKISRLKLQIIPNEETVPLQKFTSEEIEAANVAEIEKELQAAENHLKVAKPNLKAIEEYRKVQDVFVERSRELEEISNKRIEMRKLLDSLRAQRKEEFVTGYKIIKMKLKEMYQMITLGGDADFEMVDSYDPFTEGIQFNVRPPKKSWKKISNLSGGEKTLSSLALVFALHYYKPSPLYVMDEIDAALDFKNVSIVGHYIKDRTKNAQFIIISLRSNMFELCDNLVGIYKTYNCTKSITIDPRIYDNAEKADQQRTEVANTATEQNVSTTFGVNERGNDNASKADQQRMEDASPVTEQNVPTTPGVSDASKDDQQKSTIENMDICEQSVPVSDIENTSEVPNAAQNVVQDNDQNVPSVDNCEPDSRANDNAMDCST